jgi:hypothetical protein
MISIIVSLLITSIISLFFSFGLKDIIGFWQAFSIATGLQIIIALIYKSFRIEQRKSSNITIRSRFDELLALSEVSFKCPCDKFTFTEEVFIGAENIFKCPTCNSNVKANINLTPILQTDVLSVGANDMQMIIESGIDDTDTGNDLSEKEI